MIQTIEAVINKQGEIQLLEPVHLKFNRRALVMILDEEPLNIRYEGHDLPLKPEGMGRYRSGRSDISENAETFLKNRVGRKKCL